jgi:hypothetical protein
MNIIEKYDEYKNSTKLIDLNEFIDFMANYSGHISPSGGGYVWFHYVFESYMASNGKTGEMLTFQGWNKEVNLLEEEITRINEENIKKCYNK